VERWTEQQKFNLVGWV